MSKLKKIPIKYTSRDFNSIKDDLLDYAKRQYPDSWKDFSKSTINSLLVENISYIGDVLSYYLDYQVNESFIDTAIEQDNVRRHARALGYKYAGNAQSYGTVSLFILIPANSDGTAPDMNYMPILKRGTTFSGAGTATFELTEDVRFDNATNPVVAARFDSSTGATTYFAVKAQGQIVSGVYQRILIDLTNESFKRFRRIRIGPPSITDVMSVTDGDGNKYYEVDNLAQEVVFEETTNETALADGVRNILKPYVASRRFVIEQDSSGTYLQFGFGSETDEQEGLANPSQIAIKMHGRRSLSKLSFDPSRLLRTDKLGLSPSGTSLTIVTKVNDSEVINVPTNGLQVVNNIVMDFDNIQLLSSVKTSAVISSLEATNEEPIQGDTSNLTNEELRVRASTYYSTQNRAVTKQDYESMIYNMPNKFGSIKRVSVVNDPSASNRRMAIYLISENSSQQLVQANSKIKSNIKNWIMQYKTLNDVIDLYDAKIVNFGINFKVAVDDRFTRFDIVGRCVQKIKDYYSDQLYIGEPIYITRLYSILSKIEGVSDVKKVSVSQKYGGPYSITRIDFEEAMSKDGSYINTPKNVIMELKFPDIDIKGVLVR